MPMLLIFIAPIFQIIVSILRVTRVILVPLYLIFASTILLGFTLSFTAMGSILDNMPGTGPHCGMPAMGVLFGGIFITLITSPIISLVVFLINRSINNREAAVE